MTAVTGAITLAAAAAGGGSEVLFGELGSALITGGLGLVGILMVSDSRRRLRTATHKIHRLEKKLAENDIDAGNDDDDD